MEQYLEGEMNGAERQWFKDSGFSAMIPVDNTPEIRAPLVNGGLLHIRRFSLVNSLASIMIYRLDQYLFTPSEILPQY